MTGLVNHRTFPERVSAMLGRAGCIDDPNMAEILTGGTRGRLLRRR